jgi:hypothetical protein
VSGDSDRVGMNVTKLIGGSEDTADTRFHSAELMNVVRSLGYRMKIFSDMYSAWVGVMGRVA